MIILKGAKSLCYNTSNSINIAGLLFLIEYWIPIRKYTVFVLVLFSFVKHKARRVSKGSAVRYGEAGCTCSVMPLHLPWSGSAAECSQSRLYQGGGSAGCRGPEGNARGASAALCLPFSTSLRCCIYLLFVRFNLF